MFSYLCTEVYLKDFDAGVRWNDADIAVDWPVSAPTLSAKDENALFLKDIAEDRLPVTRHDRAGLGGNGQVGQELLRALAPLGKVVATTRSGVLPDGSPCEPLIRPA